MTWGTFTPPYLFTQVGMVDRLRVLQCLSFVHWNMGCFGDFSRFEYLKAAFGQETRPSREADVSDDTSLLKSVSCSCGAAYFGSLKDAVS